MNLKKFLRGWHFMRWLRLGLGIYFLIEALHVKDPLQGFIATFFLFQAFTNTGCSGTSECQISSSKNNTDQCEEDPLIKTK